MNSQIVSIVIKYGAAFASGYVGSLLPVLATGDTPSQKALIAAVVPALLATGLFHSPSPVVKGTG